MHVKTFLTVAAAVASAFTASAASAAPAITSINADLSASNYTFDYQGSTFTFGFNGDYFGGGPLTISTASGGEVNTVFGQPSTNFADGRGGPVTFGSSMNYAAFGSATPIRFTNGDNFIGLRAITNAGTFYGYAFSTNNVLNTVGFERIADATVTATTAVPEPATWALMIGGIGAAGGTLRRRREKVRTTVSFG